MAKPDRAPTPADPVTSLLLQLRESGDALEAASQPFDGTAAAARLHEAAAARGLLSPPGMPVNELAATGAQLEEDAPPFDVEAGATRLLNAARARGLLPAEDPQDTAGQAARELPVEPNLDSPLSEAASEALLGGRPHGQADGLPPSAGPQVSREALAALRAAPPSPSESPGHAQAMTAFQDNRGISATSGPLLPETPHHLARRRSRTRHHGPGRLSTWPRLGLAAAAATLLIVIYGSLASLGYVPGPFERLAHAGNGAPQAGPSPHPAKPTTGPGGLAGSSAIPASSPTTTPTTSPSATGQPQSPAKLCQAYFADPLRDMGDFQKLSKAAGGPWNVLKYCQPYLSVGQVHWPPAIGGSQGSGNGPGTTTPPS